MPEQPKVTPGGFIPETLLIPAPFVNAYAVTAAPQFIRISFAEAMGPVPQQYRTAVVMPIADAESLAKAILETVHSVREIVENEKTQAATNA